MQIGTTKDQGLYNKPSAAVHPGALASGTLPQYNTIQLLVPISSDNRRSTVIVIVLLLVILHNKCE